MHFLKYGIYIFCNFVCPTLARNGFILIKSTIKLSSIFSVKKDKTQWSKT